MRFLIIGGGSIGKRHMKNLLLLGEEVVLCEPMKERADAIAGEYKVKVFHDLAQALELDFDAAIVANPNIYHVPSAVRLAQAGCHLFIEKPLSHSLVGIDELIALVEEKKLKTLIGCNWKFHPSFQRIKEMLDNKIIGKVLSFTVIAGWYLPDWHPWEDYRKGYSANRSLGGGVLLDCHEFDYLQWFLGPIKRVNCMTGRYSALEIDTEDIAEVTVELEDKALGNIHVDYIQLPSRRNYYFYGDKGTIEWSFRDKKIGLYLASTKKWEWFDEDPDYDINEMYIEEVKHFVGVLRGEAKSITDVYKARQVLAVVEAAKKAALQNKTIVVGS